MKTAMLYLERQGFPWFLFITQQLLVPAFTMLATGLLAFALTRIVPESAVARDIAGGVVYLSPGLFGFTLGLLARSRGSQFREAGRRIWFVPVCLFAAAFIAALLSNWRRAVPECFGVRGGETEEGIVAMLITFPTIACSFYALGIRLRKSRAYPVGK